MEDDTISIKPNTKKLNGNNDASDAYTDNATFNDNDYNFDTVLHENDTIDNLNENDSPLTFRSLIVGGFVGSIVTCANIWVGLKTGWQLGTSLFAAILGFFIMKQYLKLVLSFTFTKKILNTMKFTKKENCILQTTAVAAGILAHFFKQGGLSAGFQYAIPALAWAGAEYSYLTLTLWVISAAYYGLFFAIPLRKYSIIDRQLKFPTGTAAAYTIHNMHESTGTASLADYQAKVMIYCFVGAFVWNIASAYVPVIYNLPIFFFLSQATGWVWACKVSSWHWSLNTSPAFMGIGMLMGMKAAASFCAGCIVAYGVIGPLLVHNNIVNDIWGYTDPLNNPSAQYWLLWPGISFIICGSFSEFFVTMPYKAMFNYIKRKFYGCSGRSHDFEQNEEVDGNDNTDYNFQEEDTNDNNIKLEDGLIKGVDPALASEQVPTYWWVSGLLASVVVSMAVLIPLFNMLWYEVLIALILGFIFAFIAVQATGETDINPIGTAAKASQLVFATISDSIYTNLIAGNITAASASQSVDMIQDLKTGLLLRVGPKYQFVAQAVGSLFGIVFSVAAYKMVTSAYPCIVTLETSDYCKFQVPAGKAWYGFALAINDGGNLPTYSNYAVIVAAVIAIIIPIIGNSSFFIKRKLNNYVPSISAFGLAFISGQPYLGVTMLLSASFVLIWSKLHSQSCKNYYISVASGLATGEGVAGICTAVLTIANLVYEWNILLPANTSECW